MNTKKFTKIGKWYGIVSLVFIAFFFNPVSIASQASLSSALWLALQGSLERSLIGFLILSFLSILWIALTILGIVMEQGWAKWLIFITYGLVFFISLNILTNLRYATTDSTDLTMLTVVLIKTLPALAIAIVGTVLILRKPKA
jgi:hypothetical protein